MSQFSKMELEYKNSVVFEKTIVKGIFYSLVLIGKASFLSTKLSV